MNKVAIITGIRGMCAAYLSEILLSKGYTVIGTDRRSGSPNYWRLEYLGIKNNPNLKFEYMDITDPYNVAEIITKHRPEMLFNLAAQTFVGVSFNQPILTNQVNYIGFLNILEAVRKFSPETKVYQASSSEIYGRVLESPQNEQTYFNPVSPYGISKTAAHLALINYRETYNLFICGAINFNNTSSLRGIEFISKKVTTNVARIKYEIDYNLPITPLVVGNIEARRDWSHSKDTMYGAYLAMQYPTPDDYVFSSGSMHSIKELIELSFKYGLNIELKWDKYLAEDGKEYPYAYDCNYSGGDKDIFVKVSPEFYRPNEVDVLCGNSTKAREILNWKPQYHFNDIIKEMVIHDCEFYKR